MSSRNSKKFEVSIKAFSLSLNIYKNFPFPEIGRGCAGNKSGHLIDNSNFWEMFIQLLKRICHKQTS